VKSPRILCFCLIAVLLSVACMIPQEMVSSILPPTSTITPTETLTPLPSLTPFQPLSLTNLPGETASQTFEVSMTVTFTVSPTGTLTILPTGTATQTLAASFTPSSTLPLYITQTSTVFRSPTPTRTRTIALATSTRTVQGPSATASRTRTPGPTYTRTLTRTPGPTLTASPTYNGGQITPAGPVTAMQLINAMNQLRVANGYPALKVNSILMGTAQWTAEYMAANHSNGHIGNVSGRIAAAGYGNGATVFATENWARGFATLSQIMSAWSDSLHMIPATNPYLTDIGAGVATGPWGPYYILHAAYSVGPTTIPSPTRTRTRT
jgi:uncharacterized protein YkwD